MKTIKQIADELGVSKQAVRKHVDKLPLELISRGSNHTILIDDDGASIIHDRISTSRANIDTNQVSTVYAVVDMLQKELEYKNRLLDEQQQSIKELTASNRELTAALENTTASLQAAQALHAGTIQHQLLPETLPDPDEPLQPNPAASPVRVYEKKSRGFFGWLNRNKSQKG